MKRRHFYRICIFAVCAIACNGQMSNSMADAGPLNTNGFPFLETHDLNAGQIQGSVSLTVENPTLKTGDAFSVRVRFVNAGRPWDFYNLFFNSRMPLPGQIALYDGKHKYIGEIVPWASSVIGASPDDWIFLPGGGCTLEFPMTFRPNRYLGPLAAGDYYLQFIFYKAFIALDPPWRETDPDPVARRSRLADFETHFDRSELFRSNPVKITIVK